MFLKRIHYLYLFPKKIPLMTFRSMSAVTDFTQANNENQSCIWLFHIHDLLYCSPRLLESSFQVQVHLPLFILIFILLVLVHIIYICMILIAFCVWEGSKIKLTIGLMLL